MMNVGFSEEEYERVREWIVSAITLGPAYFTEEEMLGHLRSEKWHLITTPHSATVLEMYRDNGELIANALVMGGHKGKALREILPATKRLGEFLKTLGFVKLIGTPRKEFYRVLQANGFEKQEQEELVLRL